MKHALSILAFMVGLGASPALAQSVVQEPLIMNMYDASANAQADAAAPIDTASVLAAPARSSWSTLLDVRFHGEGYLADIARTRAQGVPVSEVLGLVRYDDPQGDFWVAADVWNMEALEDRDMYRCAVHETDYEIEAGVPDLVGSADVRGKIALYEVCGEDIVSYRLAADYPLGDSLNATSSVELLTGGAEGVIVQPFSPNWSATSGEWSFYADIRPGYNTLTDQVAAPFNLRVNYGSRWIVGAFIRGYLAEDGNDATVGVRAAYNGPWFR